MMDKNLHFLSQHIGYIGRGIGFFFHRFNKGGAEEINRTMLLKATEARSIAGGGMAARATYFTSLTIANVKNGLIFTTDQEPISDREGGLVGLRWSEDLILKAAIFFDDNGNSTQIIRQ